MVEVRHPLEKEDGVAQREWRRLTYLRHAISAKIMPEIRMLT